MEEIKCPQCKNRLTPPFERCWICGWEAKGEEKRRAKKLYERWTREKFGKGPGVKKEKEVVFRPKRRAERRPKKEGAPRKRRGAVVVVEKGPAEEDEIPEAIVEEEVEMPTRSRKKTAVRPPVEEGGVEKEEEEVIPVPCRCGYTIQVKVWEGMKEVVFRCPKCGREGRISLEEEEEEEEEEEVFEGEPVEEEEAFEEEARPRRRYAEFEEERPARRKRGRMPKLFEEEEEELPVRKRRGRARRRELDLFEEEEEEDISSLTYKKPPRGRRAEPSFTVAPKETTEGEVKRCPVCGKPLRWKENLELWYCSNCKEYY